MYIECRDEYAGYQTNMDGEKISDCQILKDAGKCESNDVAKRNCKKTCELCGTSGKGPGKRTVFTL